MGQLSETGRMLLLGLCDGDRLLAEEVRAAIFGDKSINAAARDARMARTTFQRFVARVRAGLARVITDGTDPGTLVEDAA